VGRCADREKEVLDNYEDLKDIAKYGNKGTSVPYDTFTDFYLGGH
jgi:hypothetical protein